MPDKIKLRRGTAALWTERNPVLAAGEPGLETDTRKIKYGDGSTAWNSLAYSYTGAGGGGGSGDVSGPGSSTDNALVRWDGTTGELVQNSTSTLSDAGLLTTTSVTVTNLTVSGALSLPAGTVTLAMLSSAVQTSLGKADSAVQPGGALGTPASGTLTNCTGLPTAGLVNGAVTMAKINQASATLGQVIMWNGTAWAPSSAYVDNAGLSTTLEAYVTTSALTTALSDYATDTDVTNALADYELPQLGATSGQVLTWSGTAWDPATPASPSVAAGSITTAKLADAAVTMAKLNQASATSGQVLTWSGTAWAPATPASPSVADGSITTAKLADAAVTMAKLNQASATSGQVITWNGTAWAPATPASPSVADGSITTAKLANLAVTAAKLGTDVQTVSVKYLTADLGAYSSTSLTDLTGLTCAVVAGETWRFEARVVFRTSGTTKGIKVAMNGPASSFIAYFGRVDISTSAQAMKSHTAWEGTTDGTLGPGASNQWEATVRGVATVTANGTLAVRYACFDAAVSVTVMAASDCVFTRISQPPP